MEEIILNEKEWCEQKIAELDLGGAPAKTVMRIARYYFDQGKSKRDVRRALEDFIIKCDPMASLVRWRSYLDYCIAKASKRKLIEVVGVGITKRELDVIESVSGQMLRRVLFTLVCLAKYSNAINKDNNNWVNSDYRTIFTLANINNAYQRRLLMLNDLSNLGLVRFSKKVDNTNIMIPFVDEEGKAIVHVSDFRNLGNQYMRLYDHNYIECANCGLVVKRHSNRQQYCRECAAEISRQQILHTSKYTDTCGINIL